MEFFERWLVNHGWPCIEDIELDELFKAISCYGEYKPEWEPCLL